MNARLPATVINNVQHLAESSLVDRSLNSGDQLAFAELVRRHQSELRYSLRQLTRWDEALADDLVQETFMRAWQKLSSFRGDAKFSTWLYRIAYNQFLQYCRKKKLDTDELFEDMHQDESNRTGDHGFHRALANAMARLSPEARSVMHLSLHRQCTQQEISNIMGIPLGSVKTHINRSRPLLQSQLADWRE